MQDSYHPTSEFDVFKQSFTLLEQDGHTIFHSSTSAIEDTKNLLIQSGIIFGTQIGASLMLLLVLLLMTSSDKRRSLAFAFSTLALFFNFIRCTLQCLELTGPLTNFVVLELGDFNIPGVRSAQNLSICCTIITLIVFLCMETALFIQVRVVCLAASRAHRLLVTICSGVVALMATGFRFYLAVVNAYNTAHIQHPDSKYTKDQDWAQRASNIVSVVSISYFSLIFCGKLAIAIRSRRSIGMKQFGAMQIIFIMGCQTLIVPAIFAILDYYVIRGAQFNSFIETLVVIFLPLSSMWATASIKNKSSAVPGRDVINHKLNAIPVGHYLCSDATDNQRLVSQTTDTLVDHSTTDSTSGSPRKEKTVIPRFERTGGGHVEHRDSYLNEPEHDLEMQKYNIGRAR